MLTFSNYDEEISAAVHGQGVALGRRPLVDALLADGRLVHLVMRADAAEDLLTGVHDIQAVLHRHRDQAEGRAAAAFVEALVGAWGGAMGRPPSSHAR